MSALLVHGAFSNKNEAGHELMLCLRDNNSCSGFTFIDHLDLTIPLLDGAELHVVTASFFVTLIMHNIDNISLQ